MVLSGLRKLVFNYDFMEHQHHEQSIRVQENKGIHPMVSIYANRLMTSRNPLWTSDMAKTKFSVLSLSANLVHFEIADMTKEVREEAHINDATNMIVRWYASEEQIKMMSSKQINELIWERQTE
jgi:hypothetical protein